MEGNWNAFGFKYDNSYTSTKFISALEADGKDEILNYLTMGSGNKISYDPKEYYLAGDQITPDTMPMEMQRFIMAWRLRLHQYRKRERP